MAIVRWILGRLILLIDWLTTPGGVKRPPEQQAALNQQTAHLSLYQFQACPFCVKVRRFLKRNSLQIETRDAKRDPQYRNELLSGGGEIKVPCLRIDNDQGDTQWLYESDEIISYLEQRYLKPNA
ncbi:glutaredoxin family protein [Sedimenticola thiotaurini]|uniref:Glutaredoxin n=1 Tax=Sedimenticola thiotaurini TaxID=1543721 RepID=A0A0F7JXP4_9GAMM|nr:glutaredoxin domain-containing protein [Sedimenticola thiotaurini]AKH20069.1 glutaredoxin [Sedimenticola thiotaurini]